MNTLHDEIVEKQVLGICYNFQHWPEGLEPHHFGSPALSAAYRAHLDKEALDLPIVSEKYQYPLNYVLDAIDEGVTDSMLSTYIEKVLELSARREAVKKANKIIKSAHDLDLSLEEMGIESDLQYNTLSPDEFYNSIDENLTDVSILRTRFDVINKLLPTFDNSEILMIVGRPGTGKSALGKQILDSICQENDEEGLFFQLEMNQRATTKRNANEAYYKRFPLADMSQFLRDRGKWYDSRECKEELRKGRIHYNFEPLHVKQIRDKVRVELKKHPKIKNILLDYMLLVECDGNAIDKMDGPYRQVTKAFSEVGKEFNVKIIIINQTKKSGEAFKDGSRVTMSDSYGGGGPLRDIHYYMGLWNHIVDGVKSTDRIWVGLDKSREGDLGHDEIIGKYGVYMDNFDERGLFD